MQRVPKGVWRSSKRLATQILSRLLIRRRRYWDVITRTIAARPQQAALGGDPSVAAHVKAYLNVKFYHQGAWEERLEVRNGSFYHELND